jgi:hypothetical protein
MPASPEIAKTCKFIETEEMRRETLDLDVLIPVCDFSWSGETIDEVSVHTPTLAKEIATAVKLVGVPQSVDLQTKSGVRASCAMEHQRRSYENSQSLFFMREELLRKYPQEQNESLLWVIWGEREVATHLLDQ